MNLFRSCRRPLEPVSQVLAAPFIRLKQDAEMAVPGSAVGAVSALWIERADLVLVGVLVVLALASAVDTFYGRKRARLAEAQGQGKYDPIIAHMGVHSKIIGGLLVMLFRGGEWLFAQVAIETHGAIAVTIACMLLLREIRSIDGHRIAFGGGPIPFVHSAIRWLEQLLENAFGQLPENPKRRASDREEATDP